MVRTMKKIMSIMLALVMMVSVCSISTFAASTPDSDFVYTNNGNGTIAQTFAEQNGISFVSLNS